MIICYRCKTEYPSERVRDIHARHCNGTPGAQRISGPQRAITPAAVRMVPSPAARVTPSAPVRMPSAPERISGAVSAAIATGRLPALLETSVAFLMGFIIWGCYIALTQFVSDGFWFLLLLAGAAMAMGLTSLALKVTPNELAAQLVSGPRQAAKPALVAAGFAMVSSVAMYVSTLAIFGEPSI